MNNSNNEQEEVIEIKGMHCKSCAQKIEAKLSQLKGVAKARASLVEEKVYVRFDPAQASLDTIRKEIENIGYETKEIEETNEIESIGYETVSNSKTKKSSIKQGIIYGLVPHIGCIAFIVASIFGVTVATQFFRPLLLNPYFFYSLIALSLVFATVSALLYLKRNQLLSIKREGFSLAFEFYGIKRKWKYLSTLYGTTIGINLLLFMIIFPLLANVSVFPTAATAAPPTGAFIGVAGGLTGDKNADGSSSIRLKVDIPCSGHAPLISGELKAIDGVTNVQFSFPNIFDVSYNPEKTSKQQILSLEVFKTYKATVLSEAAQQNNQQADSQPSNSQQSNSQQGSVGGCGGAGGCSCGVR